MTALNPSGPKPPALYLASQSPRRREILAQIGVPFALLSVAVVEQRNVDESLEDYVTRLAAEKARAGCQGLKTRGETGVVMGADTVVVCAGELLEKPVDQAHALAMLEMLSGCEHEVLTAVSLCEAPSAGYEEPSAGCEELSAGKKPSPEYRQLTRLSSTRVRFRTVMPGEAERYWLTGEPQDKAGGYGIQGLGAVFVESITGSYSGVVGLPIAETIALLDEFDLSWWQ